MTTTVCFQVRREPRPRRAVLRGCGQPLSAGPAAGSPAGPGAAGARKVRSSRSRSSGRAGCPRGDPGLHEVRLTPAGQPSRRQPGRPSSPVTRVRSFRRFRARPSRRRPPPGRPGTASVLLVSESTPPAVPVASGSALPPGAERRRGRNAGALDEVWKDPLAEGASRRRRPRRHGRSRPDREPAAPPSNHMASGPPPDARPAAPAPPQVSRTYDCSENVIFNITPEDIHITVDGHSIGTADRWDGATEGGSTPSGSPAPTSSSSRTRSTRRCG